ncbi:recombination mediator RecR [Desulfolucanica intricata]|uniref:recombination mediator RecR n=1 Tax=Desulfolucanica intricata TaxID=1285191 RepID=UPI00082FC3B7|nr:recombination mediator RecR [Desulfolucanica intricata]
MLYHSGAVGRLIKEFSMLPGIGPKTAQRIVFHLLNAPQEVSHRLAAAVLEARDNIKYCSVCSNLTDTDPCPLCSNETRDRSIICVVQEPRDVIAMENSHSFKGFYHVLHGAISPMDGIKPEDLKIKELLDRLHKENIKEVVMATNSNVEGDATALYLARLIKPLGIKVTRIAYGLPVGAYLEYADGVTLSKALEGRKEI